MRPILSIIGKKHSIVLNFPRLFLHFAENLKSRDMTPTAGNS